MKTINVSRKQTGAVSLFVVVFAMLFMSVVTISFVRIMTKDQNQATGNDLAQSAYDSAQAGVEDAKRALVWYTEQCKLSSLACANAAAVIASTTCNAAIRSATDVPAGDGEIKVQQSAMVDASDQSIDAALDQAYTCVTMELETEDYLASVPANQSVLIPLTATRPFQTVTIQWFNAADISSPASGVQLDSTSQALLPRDSWGRRPSLLRTQFMQVGSNFALTDFDATTDSKSNANTVFLYPTRDGSGTETLVERDIRGDSFESRPPASTNWTPLMTKCNTTVSSGGYACSMQLRLPAPVGASDRNAAQSFLRLTPFYAASHIRVTLSDGAQFNGVQPIVDSTGRASTVFRRVQSRVDMFDTNSFPYPEAAVEVTGNFCKDFGVTDTAYLDGDCTP